MNKKFMIHGCPGAGTFFLTSAFAKVMNIPIMTTISPLGDCHNLGNGDWNNYHDIVISHVFNVHSNRLQLKFIPNKRLYITEVVSNEFIKQNTDINVIGIGAEPDDYYYISLMLIKKAWPNFWTQEEYNKWVGKDYPPYGPNNIAESNLICKDLMDNVVLGQVSSWFEEFADINYYSRIDFKTIMGINNKNLVQEIANITGGQEDSSIIEFVNKYQQLNKNLYFNL